MTSQSLTITAAGSLLLLVWMNHCDDAEALAGHCGSTQLLVQDSAENPQAVKPLVFESNTALYWCFQSHFIQYYSVTPQVLPIQNSWMGQGGFEPPNDEQSSPRQTCRP